MVWAEQFGVVSNIWSVRLAKGDRFEDLARRFRDAGFRHLELRDGGALRATEFGEYLATVEAASDRHGLIEWKTLCEGGAFERANALVDDLADVTISYAMDHPWLDSQMDAQADENRILRGAKLALLLNRERPRLRIVDRAARPSPNAEVAAANLKRYRALLLDLPMTLAVENARQSAVWTLAAAERADVLLTYDEANTVQADGTALNDPGDFWNVVETERLTCAHMKQRGTCGVLPAIDEGRIDLQAVMRRLSERDFGGDVLIENAPSDDPLRHALRSRDYLVRSL